MISYLNANVVGIMFKLRVDVERTSINDLDVASSIFLVFECMVFLKISLPKGKM